jgi:glycosyltransferase involved in cell wall biosynthesis
VTPPVDLEVVLPVHNEAERIEATIDEIFRVISPIAKTAMIVSEDGSSDGTPEILERLAGRHPMKLISGTPRKGYSKAVLDGVRLAEAPYVLCLDSDGQCDPADFAKFWAARESADVLIGWRRNRQDTTLRKVLSGAFKRFHRLLFRVHLSDPSCPFVLARREVFEELSPQLGLLSQGFWWEFVARVHASGKSIAELPVQHRQRAAGKTQVYRLSKIPSIGWSHGTGLVRIWAHNRRATSRGRRAASKMVDKARA